MAGSEVELNNDFFSDDNNGEEESRVISNVQTQIEQDLSLIRDVTEEISKMREKVAILESDLLTRVDSSTWKDISELIGTSGTTIINDCMKILDLQDETDVFPAK